MTLNIYGAADVVVALIHDKPSVGVQFELGYAVAKGKQVIVAHDSNHRLAYFNQGLVGAGLLTQVSYAGADALIAQLTVAVHAPPDSLQ